MALSSVGLPRAFLREVRFTVLTVSLVLFLFVLVPLRSQPGELRFLGSVLFSFVLLSSILACARRRGTLIVAAVLAPVAICLVWLLNHFGHEGLAMARYSTATALLLFTALVVLVDVMTSPRVTFDVVTGGIAVYLLMAMVWMELYTAVYLGDPQAFQMTQTLREFHEAALSHHDLQIFAYYSVVTLTTLGYGDIVPVSALARALAALEAVIGQIYMTVLVARLVGLHISSSGQLTTRD